MTCAHPTPIQPAPAGFPRKFGGLGAVVPRLPMPTTKEQHMIGALSVEMRPIAANTSCELRIAPTKLLLIAANAGEADLISDGDRTHIGETHAALVARTSVTLAAGTHGADVVIVRLPRSTLQAEASRQLHGAHRVASGLHALTLAANETRLADLIAAASSAKPPIEDEFFSQRFMRTLVETLSAALGAETAFPASRSVNAAIKLIESQCDRAWDLSTLAAATHVTVETLRKGFKACLDQSVSAFLMETRLQRARTSLGSGRDSRTIVEVARSVGFKTSGSLSRAYARRFGETPSQTRSLAVKSNGGR